MFAVSVALFAVGAVLLTVASWRFDRLKPSWRIRIVSMLIAAAVMGTVYLATLAVAGRPDVSMMPVGVICMGVAELVLVEVLKRRALKH